MTCEPCAIKEPTSATYTWSTGSQLYDVSCHAKRSYVGKDATEFRFGMPVKIDPATGIVEPDPSGEDAIGISLSTKTSTDDAVISVARANFIVDWADVAAALDLDATEPAAFWTIHAALLPKNIYVEEV